MNNAGINALMGKLYPNEVPVSEREYCRVEGILRTELAAADPSYRVTYEYTDQFGVNRRETIRDDFLNVGPAQQWAERHFAKVAPDAWWIEEVRTVEYHDGVGERS